MWKVFRVVLAGRAALVAENLALRRRDRVLWAWLSRIWKDWRSNLVIVKPDTVVSWHRQDFRLYWRWGCSADSRRATQARHRGLAGDGVQVHGPPSQATVTIVAGFSQQPLLSCAPAPVDMAPARNRPVESRSRSSSETYRTAGPARRWGPSTPDGINGRDRRAVECRDANGHRRYRIRSVQNHDARSTILAYISPISCRAPQRCQVSPSAGLLD